MNTHTPVWLNPVTLEDWPVQAIQSNSLRYALSLHQEWDSTPQHNETPLEKEHIYRGIYPSDCLCVSFMEQADPSSNLQNWAEAMVRLTGFPIQALRLHDDEPPKLLEWRYEGTYPLVTKRLEVDEAHVYQGLAMLHGRPPELVRFYILLARRGQFAWKVSLAFSSACLPGCATEMVTANDHVRAGATFGSLQFLTVTD